jgi:3-hydroxyacyl-[acyl-carrier-protein] dehydratase
VNEPHFTGHWPEKPVMPGVLILEAMAQATAILAFKTMEVSNMPRSEDGIFYFAGIDNARFKQPVIPGDQLVIETVLGKSKGGIWMCSANATVDGKVVCSADLIAAYREVKQ